MKTTINKGINHKEEKSLCNLSNAILVSETFSDGTRALAIAIDEFLLQFTSDDLAIDHFDSIDETEFNKIDNSCEVVSSFHYETRVVA